MRPTAQQQAVITHEEGRAVVFAVAGSGKTTTVTRRIDRLISVSQVQPNRILATTFGREAKRQVSDKLLQFPLCRKVDIRTLHSLAFKVYTYDRQNLPPKNQADDNELQALFYRAIDRIRAGNGINYAAAPVDREKIEETSFADFANYLMQLKGDMLATPWMHEKLPAKARPFFDIEEFPGSPTMQVLIDTYEDERKRESMMGYDDIMVNAVVRIGSNEDVRRAFSSMYEFIIVDEYQDVNKAQNMMLTFMDERHQNMMVVGDDDQTIYEWRGARPTFIKQKLSDAAWKVFKLDRNFRSSPGPVVLASQVISKNQERAEKNMMATRPFSGVLDIRRMDSDRAQAQEIVELVRQYTEDSGDLNRTVVLIRQYAETPLLEQSLINAGIRYEIPGSEPFYSRRETSHILAYLELLNLEHKRVREELTGPQQEDFGSLWSRIYTRPKTFLKKTELTQLLRNALSDYPRTPIAELLDSINRQRIDRGERLAELDGLIRFFGLYADKHPDEIQGADAIQSLQTSISIKNWIVDTAIHPSVGEVKSQILDALSDYAYELSLTQFLDSIAKIKEVNETAQRGSSEPTLKILTVFKSKGLEFSNVIIPNANSAPLGGFAERTSARNPQSIIEEERRIFYVAMTRAIDNLHIFHTSAEPSQYLSEANYKDVLQSMGSIQKVFNGDLGDAEKNGAEYFANSVLTRLVEFQLGNACARNWATALNRDQIDSLQEKGLQWLNEIGAKIQDDTWENSQYERIQREWHKICAFRLSKHDEPGEPMPVELEENPKSQAYLFDKLITVPEIEFE